jgi:hypothetical protein
MIPGLGINGRSYQRKLTAQRRKNKKVDTRLNLKTKRTRSVIATSDLNRIIPKTYVQISLDYPFKYYF